MKIQTIKIRNFRNFAKFEMDFQDRNDIIRDNAFGKSNIADAISWVIVGKLMDGSSDIESIKPKHDMKALVEVELVLNNGTHLKKTYQENWVKIRGTEKIELKGNTTTCYINDLELPVTQYDQEFESIVKTTKEHYLMLINPLYFGLKMEWRKRRELINAAVGEVTFDEIVQSSIIFTNNKELTTLLKTKFQQYNNNIDSIKKSMTQSLTKLKKEETELEGQISGLMKLETQITKKEADSLMERVVLAKNNLNKRNDVANTKARIESLNNQLAQLRSRFKEVDAEKYLSPEIVPQKCPKCNYILNEQEHKRMLDTNTLRQLAFDESKKKRLESINNEGQRYKKELETLQSETAQIDETDSADIAVSIVEMNNQIAEFNAYEKAQVEIGNVNLTLKKARAAITETESLIDLLTAYVAAMLQQLNKKIEAVFGDVKIRLIEQNIKEGSWNEVCDVMDGNVPYDRTNTSQQIKLGVKVIEALRKQLNFTRLPIVIDNAEVIVDRTFETDNQVICLIAGKE